MYYELYVDSLFLVNFVMNLYLLILVNHRLLRTATRKRLIGAAGAGALCYLLPFVVNGPVWAKYGGMVLLGTWLMIYIAFRPKTLRGYLKILGCLCKVSFLLGGVLLFANSVFSFGQILSLGVWGVLGVGAIAVMWIRFLIERRATEKFCSTCKVTLIKDGKRIVSEALLDSGNSLTEPVSGQPVSVIDRMLFEELWGDENALFRAIPYHSIGCRHGILKGYLLPVLEVETDGITKHLENVYVAIMPQSGKIPVIIHPGLLNREKMQLIQRKEERE